MKTSDYVNANLAAWDQVAPIHEKRNGKGLKAAFQQPGFSCLDQTTTRILNQLEVVGKSVAQLCCNNGRELLSVKNMGANHCVGFDGSQAFIEQARELAACSNIDCDFTSTNVYEIGHQFDAQFDVVIITIGVLSWMPDLPRFFAIAKRMLKPGGALFIHEQHPIIEMFEPGDVEAPIVWELSYFKPDVFVDTGGLDYYGGQSYDSKPTYSFIHKMSDIIMAGVNLGLTIEHFEELPHHISNTWYNLQNQPCQLPMSYTLVMRIPV